jgi:hypothetical protein
VSCAKVVCHGGAAVPSVGGAREGELWRSEAVPDAFTRGGGGAGGHGDGSGEEPGSVKGGCSDSAGTGGGLGVESVPAV